MTYHILYKTTCLITNKFYYGVHSTEDLKDNYLGSGIILRRSLKKHGRTNHIRTIVNKELLSDPMCLNVIEGGTDGYEKMLIEEAMADTTEYSKMKPEEWIKYSCLK